MDIYIYSDESGVFDKAHNDIFVYGGLLFLDKSARDECSRKYSAAEKCVRTSEKLPRKVEIKASNISNKHKASLFRALNNYNRFGVVIDQRRVTPQIFYNKKSKQRYLDYAFKIGLKKYMQALIQRGEIAPASVEHISIFADEHTTATDGRYELREALEHELKIGTINFDYNRFFPPIFPSVKDVQLTFCNSSSNLLVRASDIIANKLFYWARHVSGAGTAPDVFIHRLP